jgi:hypothetical protein
VTGAGNSLGIDSFGGDYGDYYATATQAGLVMHGIEVNNLSVTGCLNRAAQVTGNAGLITHYMDAPIVIRGGSSTGDNSSTADIGIYAGNSKGGYIGPIELSLFGIGIKLHQRTDGYHLDAVNVHDNKLSGINCQGSGADKSINHVITAPRAYNNNTSAVSSLDSDTTICGGNASVFISRVNASGKRIGQGTVAPTTGTWVAGDIVENTATAAGGTPGWVCTTGGTPGTWKAMASVAA